MYEGMKNDDLTRLNMLLFIICIERPLLRLFCSICALSVYLYWFGITKYHRFNVEPRNLKKKHWTFILFAVHNYEYLHQGNSTGKALTTIANSIFELNWIASVPISFFTKEKFQSISFLKLKSILYQPENTNSRLDSTALLSSDLSNKHL